MSGPVEEVDDMERLLAAIAADWQLLQTLRHRLPLSIARARRGGVKGRVIARATGVPERTVRRMSDPYLTCDDETEGAA